MREKGVIRDVVTWERSREFFYWRLRRRLLECRAANEVRKATAAGGGRRSREDPTSASAHAQTMEMLRRWYIEDRGQNQRFLWEQDRPVVEWLEEQVPACPSSHHSC